MTTSSSDANQANEDLSQWVTDPERFKEKFGIKEVTRILATDQSQGQGMNAPTGDIGEVFHDWIVGQLGR